MHRSLSLPLPPLPLRLSFAACELCYLRGFDSASELFASRHSGNIRVLYFNRFFRASMVSPGGAGLAFGNGWMAKYIFFIRSILPVILPPRRRVAPTVAPTVPPPTSPSHCPSTCRPPAAHDATHACPH
jgi:hypothetical protein